MDSGVLFSSHVFLWCRKKSVSPVFDCRFLLGSSGASIGWSARKTRAWSIAFRTEYSFSFNSRLSAFAKRSKSWICNLMCSSHGTSSVRPLLITFVKGMSHHQHVSEVSSKNVNFTRMNDETWIKAKRWFL